MEVYSCNYANHVVNVKTINPSEKWLNQTLINLLSGGSTRKRKLYNY